MKIGLVGPSAQERSLAFDAQRTINAYPVFDEQGKEVAALYGTPGLKLFASIGASPIAGVFTASNGRAFAVSNDTLYELSVNGTVTIRGVLAGAVSFVSMAENGLQLAVCDGSKLYIFTYATNTMATVTDVDLPSCGMVTFIDGYFIVTKNNTGSFYKSSLYDGLTWDALDFASAESSPDPLNGVYSVVGQVWLMGEETGEIWTNSGGSGFPFQRISGAKMEVGILAKYTGIALDNSFFWVGKDKIGSGIVYRANGFIPERISTSPIEKVIQEAPNPTTMRSYAYQEDGHVFYVVTGGGLKTTLVYDLTTRLWHERAYLNNGEFEQHLGSCAFVAFGKLLVGSRRAGKIYDMSLDYFDDDGDEMALDRIYTHVFSEGENRRYSLLAVGVETGIGVSNGKGSDPVMSLRISHDGAKTWTSWFTASIGKLGEYSKRAVFRRLGVSAPVTFNIRITDPVKRAITGSYLT